MADRRRTYVGIQNDLQGGMTDTGRIIRDAWIFGLIPETETCEGWMAERIEELWRKVNVEWEKYGFLVGQLPPEIRERFDRIQADAFTRARGAGWDPDKELAGDEE